METIADKMGFDKTEKNSAKSYISHPTNMTEPVGWLAKNGDAVFLCFKGQEFQVRDVELKSNGIIIGEIQDFTNNNASEFEGFELGQEITFRHRHVHHLIRE